MLIPDLLRLFGRLRDHGWYFCYQIVEQLQLAARQQTRRAYVMRLPPRVLECADLY